MKSAGWNHMHKRFKPFKPQVPLIDCLVTGRMEWKQLWMNCKQSEVAGLIIITCDMINEIPIKSQNKESLAGLMRVRDISVMRITIHDWYFHIMALGHQEENA